jgi:hypothetical protein
MVITLLAKKGGVGKSTVCLLLHEAFKKAGKSVAIQDWDGQGTSTKALSLIDGQRVMPNGEYDIHLYDTPPNLEHQATAAAVRSADIAIVATTPAPAGIWEAAEAVEFVKAKNPDAKESNCRFVVPEDAYRSYVADPWQVRMPALFAGTRRGVGKSRPLPTGIPAPVGRDRARCRDRDSHRPGTLSSGEFCDLLVARTLKRLQHLRWQWMARFKFLVGALFVLQVGFNLLGVLQNVREYAVHLR